MKWIRPVLGIIGYLAVIFGFFMGMIDRAAFFGLIASTITWWFVARDKEKDKVNGGSDVPK